MRESLALIWVRSDGFETWQDADLQRDLEALPEGWLLWASDEASGRWT
jgi:hypothetical protein